MLLCWKDKYDLERNNEYSLFCSSMFVLLFILQEIFYEDMLVGKTTNKSFHFKDGPYIRIKNLYIFLLLFCFLLTFLFVSKTPQKSKI